MKDKNGNAIPKPDTNKNQKNTKSRFGETITNGEIEEALIQTKK